MLLGFAIASHCNLRCPHCIRDDVVTPRELAPELIARVVDEGLRLWGDVTVSMTGGEPLIHRRFADIVEIMGSRQVPYRFVSNGWHLSRIVPLLRRYPAEGVRLSLSGGDEVVHDSDRGRGSYRRVLMGVGLLRHLGIPASLSIVIDRRSRHQIEETARLAEDLGCRRLHYILPQPVPGSLERDTDMPPEDWWAVAREVRALGAEWRGTTEIQLDYGAPFEGAEATCDTFALKRVYVDAHGRLSTCCQLSDYGDNEVDVIADLNRASLIDAWPEYLDRLDRLRSGSAAPAVEDRDEFDAFPCIRCARFSGKMEWVRDYRGRRWASSALPPGRPGARFIPSLVQLSSSVS